jgi:hypothetical protein
MNAQVHARRSSDDLPQPRSRGLRELPLLPRALILRGRLQAKGALAYTLLDDRHVEERLLHRNASRAQGNIDDYGVAISPLAVATIQRLPQRTIESIRPIPGTVSPRAAVRTPSGPSRTTVPPRTSSTVQPSMVVGLVSGAATIGSRAVIVVLAWVRGGALAESTEGRMLPDGLAGGSAPVVETAFMPGVCRPGVDTAFRTPSILPPDFTSAVRCEDGWMAGLRAAIIGPHADPSPKPTTSAPAIKMTVRFRSRPGVNSSSTSSRLGLTKSHERALAGCAETSLPAASAAGSNLSNVIGWCNCMMGSPFAPQ